MLTMTEAAGGYLFRFLDETDASPDTAVRLVAAGEGIRPELDTERPGDAHLDHDGRKVLLLDPHASEMLAERTLDIEPTPDGPRLGLS